MSPLPWECSSSSQTQSMRIASLPPAKRLPKESKVRASVVYVIPVGLNPHGGCRVKDFGKGEKEEGGSMLLGA